MLLADKEKTINYYSFFSVCSTPQGTNEKDRGDMDGT